MTLSGIRKLVLPSPADALPGRTTPLPPPPPHFVSGRALTPPWPQGLEVAEFALGCFWGAERLFWRLQGVWATAVGYAGGTTPNPTYREVCSGLTGHAEVVLVVFDPRIVSYEHLLRVFFEAHDPTQGMRQGNDIGTQYRSMILTTSSAQAVAAKNASAAYDAALRARGLPPVTTEIVPAGPFYYAEEDHQQYLAKYPDGYCGLRGTGVACPLPGGETAGA